MLVHLLQDANVEVVAILNDTTGCLLAGSYLDKQCQVGLIMGERAVRHEHTLVVTVRVLDGDVTVMT